MKRPLPLSFLFLSLPLFAQDIPRIIGPVADGTPATVESVAPALDIQPEDILQTWVRDLGNRKIVIQQVAPLDLSAHAQAPVAQAEPMRFPSAETTAPSEAVERDSEFLFIGATVYRCADQPDQPLTLVRLWQQGTAEPIICWSSANWNWLGGFGSFAGADGRHYALIMSCGDEEVANREELARRIDATHALPAPPALPPGPATFQVVKGGTTPEALAPLRALHDLYHAEGARLRVAHESREAAARQREAERRAHPPRPRDITLRYWRVAKPLAATPTPALAR